MTSDTTGVHHLVWTIPYVGSWSPAILTHTLMGSRERRPDPSTSPNTTQHVKGYRKSLGTVVHIIIHPVKRKGREGTEGRDEGMVIIGAKGVSWGTRTQQQNLVEDLFYMNFRLPHEGFVPVGRGGTTVKVRPFPYSFFCLRSPTSVHLPLCGVRPLPFTSTPRLRFYPTTSQTSFFRDERTKYLNSL